MFMTALAIAAFAIGFLGLAYALALALTKAIVSRQEFREKEHRSAEYWSLRTRSSYRAF